MPDQPLPPPIPYADDQETPRPDEAMVGIGLGHTITGIIDQVHRDLGHAVRGVHAKSHALLAARVTVHPGLPPELAQGVFAGPRAYEAVVRLSSIAGDILSDSVSIPRGFALKLLDVEGERLPGAEGDTTQDFLFAAGTTFSAPDAEGFLKSLKLLAATTDRAAWAKSALSAVLRPVERALEAVGGGSQIVKTLGGFPLLNPLGERFGSQAPLRFGAYVAKLDVVPESANFRALADREFDLDGREDAIREEVAAVLAKEGGSWTLRAQLRRDAEANPIEDAAAEWPEAENPYLPVASIAVAAQESWSPERSRAVDDGLSFSPWHGIAAHRPLGNVMRARRAVYPVSAARRAALNGCPIHEPRAMPIG
ncbi:catalase family protein [Roseomonas sp. NAR14]|uniref:Catalase family protein n=1 Tax=Roseomonas acroporae TaxID=2937791 RepID=A0A9X2BUZ8_9PROT|nr:catalase family protein [Roseomonas acroporae]MCK8784556.1 catalase family protein [Roseomonas acroporae]